MTAETDRYMEEQGERALAVAKLHIAEETLRRLHEQRDTLESLIDEAEERRQAESQHIVDLDHARVDRMQAKGLPVDIA